METIQLAEIAYQAIDKTLAELDRMINRIDRTIPAKYLSQTQNDSEKGGQAANLRDLRTNLINARTAIFRFNDNEVS